jgi:hypothetical protein
MLDVMSHTCVKYRAKTDADLDWMAIATTGVTGCYADTRYFLPLLLRQKSNMTFNNFANRIRKNRTQIYASGDFFWRTL